MDPHQSLPALAQTMEKLDSALAKLQEIQCTLRGHRSSGNGDGDQKDRLRWSDGWAERVRSAAAAAPLTTKKGALQRNDVEASMAIAKKTVDMMKVQRMKSMMQKKQERPCSPSSPSEAEAAAAQRHLDMEATTFVAQHQDPHCHHRHHHHGDDEAGDGHRSKKQIKATDMVAKSSQETRSRLGHLDMEATTFLEATTFAAHHRDPPPHHDGDDEAGDGDRSKQQIKATDMVAKSSKENQDQAPTSRLAHEHHLETWKLPHLLMTRIPATDMEATTFAHHHQDPHHHRGDGAGDGCRSKKQSIKGTDMVAKSSKENQDPAHQHHHRHHHHHHHHQEQYEHDQNKRKMNKRKKKKPSSCIVKGRSKEPLDMAMVMLAPPRICVQVEEVRPSKRSKEKAAIVMFPNPTFNHQAMEEEEEEDQSIDKKNLMRVMKEEEEKKQKKKKRMEMEEKVVRLAPCHGSSRSNGSNSDDGKLAMVEKKKKQNRPCRLSHPIRDSLKRTTAFIQGMIF